MPVSIVDEDSHQPAEGMAGLEHMVSRTVTGKLPGWNNLTSQKWNHVNLHSLICLEVGVAVIRGLSGAIT